MIAVATDYQAVLAGLPPGERALFEDVSWEEYEELIGQIVARPGVRISYDQGRMEIMVTSSKHERWKGLFNPLLVTLAEELNLNLVSLGSMTFKLPAYARGVEPDDCFYIHNAAAVAGVEELDLAVDPGPELIIEIDLSSRSLNKFPIYASLGVREVWRVSRYRLLLYRVNARGDDFEPADASALFPGVTAAALQGFLDMGRKRGIIPMIRAFREWVRKQAAN